MYQYKVGDVVEVCYIPENELKGKQHDMFYPFYIKEFLNKTGTIVKISNTTGNTVRFTVTLDINFEDDELEKATAPKAWHHD